MGGGTDTHAHAAEICDGAHERGLRVHMDGARVFNAASAPGLPVREIAAPADTIMFCLSKGLGAPVGSMMALASAVKPAQKNAHATSAMARSLSSWRVGQSGRHAAKLAADHANARFRPKAYAPSRHPDRSAKVDTNIVIFDVSATGRAPPHPHRAEASRRLSTPSTSARCAR